MRRLQAVGRRLWLLRLLEELVVSVAPRPVFASFERLHERMLRGVKMPRRVLVRGRVTATDVPAHEAEAQMDPAVAVLQALLTAVGPRGGVGIQLTMPTRDRHWRCPR